MTFPEHILSARSWARRWGARVPAELKQGVWRGSVWSATGPWASEAEVTPVLVKGGQGWGAGIPQMGDHWSVGTPDFGLTLDLLCS